MKGSSLLAINVGSEVPLLATSGDVFGPDRWVFASRPVCTQYSALAPQLHVVVLYAPRSQACF